MRKLLIVLLLVFPNLILGARLNIKHLENAILQKTNFERESVGLNPLKFDAGLADVARYHSANMAKHDFFDHTDHEDMKVGDRAKAIYPQLLFNSIGENLASVTNAKDVETIISEAVTGWMNSPGHRENILNSRFSHLGIGIVRDGKKVLITQVFARPMVKLGSKIPARVRADKDLVLFFEYMRDSGAERFEAFLHFPDPGQKHFIDERTFVMGFEPFSLNWINDHVFSVRLRFNGGAGVYILTFGEGGTFLSNGFTIQVY